jgi:purine nucleoside permease
MSARVRRYRPSPAPRERDGPDPKGREGEGLHENFAMRPSPDSLRSPPSPAVRERGVEALLRCLIMAMILAFAAASPAAAAAPLPIRVVVVTMFEGGGDTGDTPGEFQDWVERLPLDEKLDFPQGYRGLRLNREKGVLGLVTGVGTARAAASIMALGMDSRFDLSHAYWLVAGIAGADPADMSLGSAAWAEWGGGWRPRP